MISILFPEPLVMMLLVDGQWEPRESPLTKMAAGGGSYTEHKNCPSPHPSGSRLGWDQGQAGIYAIEVKMVAWGGSGPESSISVAWGKKGLVGIPEAGGSLTSWLVIFGKVLIHPTPKTNIVPGEQRNCVLLIAGFFRTCLQLVYWPILSKGHMALEL